MRIRLEVEYFGNEEKNVVEEVAKVIQTDNITYKTKKCFENIDGWFSRIFRGRYMYYVCCMVNTDMPMQEVKEKVWNLRWVNWCGVEKVRDRATKEVAVANG
jgi:hypothetical protein